MVEKAAVVRHSGSQRIKCLCAMEDTLKNNKNKLLGSDALRQTVATKMIPGPCNPQPCPWGSQ
jgi:hypothetical protein